VDRLLTDRRQHVHKLGELIVRLDKQQLKQYDVLSVKQALVVAVFVCADNISFLKCCPIHVDIRHEEQVLLLNDVFVSLLAVT